jgi:hypothetical protein
MNDSARGKIIAIVAVLIVSMGLLSSLVLMYKEDQASAALLTLPETGATLLVPVDTYQLENGAQIVVWIDERYQQLCTAIYDGRGAAQPGGLDCRSLEDTPYGKQIGR